LKSPPLVTVITVCYNSALTIERALQSVASQTYKRIEHLIIDGGSNDGTLEILRTWHSKPLRLIIESDRGIYDAMNKGINLASGNIIAFLNSDDFYKEKDIVEMAVEKLISNKLDLIYGDVDFFSPKDLYKVVRRYSSKNFSPQKLAYGFMPAHPSLFIKSNVYKKVGTFDINYKIAGDFDFIVRIFKDEKLRYEYIEKVFVSMQTGGISTKGIRSTIILNIEIMQSCLKNNIHTSWIKLISRYLIKSLEFIRI
jgi:glycosyltransferase involved in cell wall biosynthesis